MIILQSSGALLAACWPSVTPALNGAKLLLFGVLQSWGLQPGKLLMVGDSLEDVECGNAAGTATCLVAGEWFTGLIVRGLCSELFS